MPCLVYFENIPIKGFNCANVSSLKLAISQNHGLQVNELFATLNGKSVSDDHDISTNNYVVRLSVRLVGGKGGFGSMLRAVGAQIQKTSNRESCRDLSGRRLRDINEAKRLKKWVEGWEERAKEAAEIKRRKLERLVAEPKINVELDSLYEKERQQLPERVSSALEAGLQVAESNTAKRKMEENCRKSKKPKLWIDTELSDCSSSLSDDEDDSLSTIPKSVVSTNTSESDFTPDNASKFKC